MTLRIAALLAALLALPGLAAAQPAPSAAHRAAPRAAVVTQQAQSGPALIDVNSADEKTLDSLPGVGAARAHAIVANRPYMQKDQLVSKKAIPANVLADISDKIALVNVNTASAADMARILPNVGPVRAQQIVARRPYASTQDLATKGALSQGILNGLRGLITTGS